MTPAAENANSARIRFVVMFTSGVNVRLDRNPAFRNIKIRTY